MAGPSLSRERSGDDAGSGERQGGAAQAPARGATPARRGAARFDPRAAADGIEAGATVGVYAETPEEAPAGAYARWFSDHARHVALPWFANRDAEMEFRLWENPHDEDLLEIGPWGVRQPFADAPRAEPDVVFVPLVGFTANGARLGMGAGHYDRWLAAHPGARAIGLAWDCQEAPLLPLEPHDRMLSAIVTPTRLFGPFGEDICR